MAEAKILVVEDEQITAMEIQSMLEDQGYGITDLVDNGRDALESLRDNLADLVIMDIRIHGDRDGIETTRLINDEFDVPVVYLSAYSDEESLERARDTKPAGFLIKPITGEDLRSTIQIALGED